MADELRRARGDRGPAQRPAAEAGDRGGHSRGRVPALDRPQRRRGPLVRPDRAVPRQPRRSRAPPHRRLARPAARAPRALHAEGRNVDFALVDGDHSSEGVRRDVEALLCSPAVRSTFIIAHDTGNEIVRAGLDAVRYDAWPKIAHVDLDFVPGYLGGERFPGEMWGGLALIVVAEERGAYGSGPVVQGGCTTAAGVGLARPTYVSGATTNVRATRRTSSNASRFGRGGK